MPARDENRISRLAKWFGVSLVALALAAPASAETFKIGVTKLASCAAIAIARDKGYFAAEGLTPDLVFFDAQQPIAVGVASGDLDFGIAATTAALYSLAGQNTLRIIAGGISEAPTFHYLSYLASNQAYAAGLKSVHDFGGHSVALTQMGTGLQYSIGLAAEKYGFDLKSIRLLPLQSNSNIASALAGGQTDAAIFSSTGALPLIQQGKAKLLGWVGDDTNGFQANLTFVSTKTADERKDMVTRFLKAYRKAAREYHDAFTGKDGKRADQATAPQILAILSNYLRQPVELVKLGLPYLDSDVRVDVKDVAHQLAWYEAQNLMKMKVSADAILDKRYIVALPGR
jgi:NitT/TauT family transport system substrate-binding protein